MQKEFIEFIQKRVAIEGDQEKKLAIGDLLTAHDREIREERESIKVSDRALAKG